MSARSTGRLDLADLGGLHRIAVALAVATGVIHVYVGAVDARLPLVLAGLGFLGGAGLFLADYRRQLLYPVGAVYTTVQIVAWAVVNAGTYTPLGYLDKAVQVALVVVLAILAGRD